MVYNYTVHEITHTHNYTVINIITLCQCNTYNYTVPEDLKTFLSAVTSEIQGPRNSITEKSNLPHDEQQALKELKNSRERSIKL